LTGNKKADPRKSKKAGSLGSEKATPHKKRKGEDPR